MQNEYAHRETLRLAVLASTQKIQRASLQRLNVGDCIKVHTPDIYVFNVEVLRLENDGVICKDLDDGEMLKATSLEHIGENDYEGIVDDLN